MAMTDQAEIKKVINIDTGNSLTILKDYKNYIDELKKSLNSLDTSSEEYKQTVEKIGAAEDVLNSLMKVKSSELTAANKKYEELTGTLRDLRKQLDDVNNASDRLEIQDKIADVTDSVADLVDETVNSSSSIKDFGDAGVSAFGKMVSGVGGVTGALNGLNGDLGQIIKVVIQCGKTAMSAGVKAAAAEAMATGGLTLIIAGIVAIIEYWDDIKGFLNVCIDKIGEMTGLQSSYTKGVNETEKAIGEMNKRLDEGNEKLSFQLRLMRAQGASAVEVARAEYNALAKQRNALSEEWKGALKRGSTEEQRQEIIKAVQETDKKLKAARENLYIERVKAAAQEKARRQAEIADANKDREKAAATQSKIAESQRSKAEAERQKAEEERKREEEQRQKAAEQILERLHKSNTDELTLLQEKYEKEKKILEDAGKETTVLTEEYNKQRLEIIQKTAEKEQAELGKNLKGQADQLKSEEEQKLYELQFQEYDGSKLEQEKAELDAKWAIEQEYYLQRIELEQEYLNNFVGTQEQKKQAEADLDKVRQEYANKKMKYDDDIAKNGKKQADEEKKYKEQALKSSLSVAGDIFGALADLSEENSASQKLFSIMQTTISTLEGAINAYKSMAGIPVVGPALGAAAAAAVTAAGIANINKIKQTTKDNAGSSVTAPNGNSLSMTSVSPLLNEETDLQRMTTLSEQGDSVAAAQQNVRVYVVDQDIRDANRKAEVVENNATF